MTIHTPDQTREQIQIGQPKCKCGNAFLVYRHKTVRKKQFLGITALCECVDCDNHEPFIAHSEAEMLHTLTCNSNQTSDNMTQEKLKADQAAIPTPELIEKARDYIGKVTEYGHREWRISIPVNRYDADMVFQEVCRRLEYWQKRCEAAEAYIEESPCDPDINETLWRAYRYWESVKNEHV